MDFKGKVVLVTGASRGIGRSIATAFAKSGANVIINYNNSQQEAEEITKILNFYGTKNICIKADISNEDEVKNMINQVINEFGKIDIVVNNAGIAIDNEFEDHTVEDWKKVMDTNLLGAFLVSKYAATEMLKNKYGKIINISSTNGIDTTYPYSIDYDASKAGLLNCTKNLAIQFAPYVNVNAVAPGWVDTDMNNELPRDYLAEEREKTLLKRFAEPEEISNVVLFLASDLSRYIDGEVIRVDGGLKLK